MLGSWIEPVNRELAASEVSGRTGENSPVTAVRRVLLFGYCKELLGALGNGHSVKIAVSGNIGDS